MLTTLLQNPLFAAVFAMVCLGLIFGGLLGFAAIKFKVEADPIADQVNALLPQTQWSPTPQARPSHCDNQIQRPVSPAGVARGLEANHR